MAASSVIYKVITNDEKVLEISKEAADRSGMLVEMMKNIPIDDVESMDPIVLEHANETVAKMVIQWCEDHKTCPVLADDKTWEYPDPSEEIQNKEKELLQDLDGEQLYELFETSNFLDVRCLRLKIAKIIAAMVSGKKYKEIRTIWQIEGDFTPEEEERNEKEEAMDILLAEIKKREAEEGTEGVPAIDNE